MGQVIHTGAGIASLILGVVSLLAFTLALLTAIGMAQPGAANKAALSFATIVLVVAVAALIASIGFGIYGRGSGYGIAGLIVSGATALTLVILIILVVNHVR
jgi:hypothetical protein